MSRGHEDTARCDWALYMTEAGDEVSLATMTGDAPFDENGAQLRKLTNIRNKTLSEARRMADNLVGDRKTLAIGSSGRRHVVRVDEDVMVFTRVGDELTRVYTPEVSVQVEGYAGRVVTIMTPYEPDVGQILRVRTRGCIRDKASFSGVDHDMLVVVESRKNGVVVAKQVFKGTATFTEAMAIVLGPGN